jgi:hypothetical protein
VSSCPKFDPVDVSAYLAIDLRKPTKTAQAFEKPTNVLRNFLHFVKSTFDLYFNRGSAAQQ